MIEDSQARGIALSRRYGSERSATFHLGWHSGLARRRLPQPEAFIAAEEKCPVFCYWAAKAGPKLVPVETRYR